MTSPMTLDRFSDLEDRISELEAQVRELQGLFGPAQISSEPLASDLLDYIPIPCIHRP